ncbi:MolR family transcriptional regulator [Comamonas thiooxydans]|uniref:MolR family transcriptional regulator n=1 Tax=Comamonas thiooxydans TaxID=363952 RepID=UPI001CCCC83F|nr:MolR family transcriptional regulator [Comamonas thiooxydans]MCO8249983.1 MolR family transcriptional regulator [Comamonas thiooxydans]UBQ44081.1 MolR family transcriptional regulator [Comamonas thiooxydans]
MSTILYFDDPDVGLARETSHPTFARIAAQDFYYDGGDDFSPFGSDDGSDTLAALEEWYQEQTGGKSAKTLRFLHQQLSDWDLPVPKDMLAHDDAAKARWLASDDMNQSYLRSVCRAHVATAFGQLKITGSIDADLHKQALLALACQQWLNTVARSKYPDWEYADQESERLALMNTALEQASAA